MASSTRSPGLPSDERKFLAEMLTALAPVVLAHYDGQIIDKPEGVAHATADLAKALLIEYRQLKNGGSL